MTNSSGVETPKCIHHRRVLPTWCILPRNTVFAIPQNKVLIPCVWVFQKSPFCNPERNGTEFRETIKFYEAANKSCLFRSFFLFQKWFGTEFLSFFWCFFSSENGSEQNSEVFLIKKWFGTEFCGFFSSEKWFRTEFRGFFSSKKWFGTEFRGFSLPRNRRDSDGTAVCSVLFCIPRNNFWSENGNPNTWGVLTPSGQYIGESWPPVVNFLVYFEQTSEQVYKKVSVTKSQGVKTPQCINYRGVLTTYQQVCCKPI